MQSSALVRFSSIHAAIVTYNKVMPITVILNPMQVCQQRRVHSLHSGQAQTTTSSRRSSASLHSSWLGTTRVGDDMCEAQQGACACHRLKGNTGGISQGTAAVGSCSTCLHVFMVLSASDMHLASTGCRCGKHSWSLTQTPVLLPCFIICQGLEKNLSIQAIHLLENNTTVSVESANP
jgi:hypothetical protein